jgi:cytochrome c peroxidase
MFSKQLFRVAVQALPNAGKRLMSTRIATRRNASFGVAFGAIVFAGASLSYVAYNDPSKEEIEQIRKEIEDAINIEFANRNDGTSMAGTLVRLAWHQSGTYSVVDKTGGSNGAHMRFAPECEWGANAGLKSARDFLEPIKAKHPNISYADLWTLSAVTAIAAMGGPQVPWRPGRTDSKEGTKVPDGRLPAADSGGVAADVNHLRSIFHRQGFSDREIVALAGAHCIGRCHREASGYWGPWTHAETTFSNEYFRLLLEERWTPKKTHLGKVHIY